MSGLFLNRDPSRTVTRRRLRQRMSGALESAGGAHDRNPCIRARQLGSAGRADHRAPGERRGRRRPATRARVRRCSSAALASRTAGRLAWPATGSRGTPSPGRRASARTSPTSTRLRRRGLDAALADMPVPEHGALYAAAPVTPVGARRRHGVPARPGAARRRLGAPFPSAPQASRRCSSLAVLALGRRARRAPRPTRREHAMSWIEDLVDPGDRARGRSSTGTAGSTTASSAARTA